MREFVFYHLKVKMIGAAAQGVAALRPVAAGRGRGMRRARGRGGRSAVYRKSGNRSAAPRAGRPGRRAGPRRMVAAALPWVRVSGRPVVHCAGSSHSGLSIPNDRRMSGPVVRSD